MTEYYEYIGSVDEEQIEDVDTAVAALDAAGLVLLYRPVSCDYEIVRWVEGEMGQ